MAKKQELFELTDLEMEVVSRAAEARKIKIDSKRRSYSAKELAKLGVFRETYSPDELQEKGLASDGVVTSFDPIARRAETELLVDTPFGSGISKWQLPIEIAGIRVMLTRFPPNTVVTPHIHPIGDDKRRGGSFRMVVKGSITYEGKRFGPGDWFFIPNGTEYSFVTDPEEETLENYDYEYLSADIPNPKSPKKQSYNRFSSPIAAPKKRK